MITYSDPTVQYSTPDLLYTGAETPEVHLVIGDRELNYLGGTLRLKHALDRRCTAKFAIESDVALNLEEGEPISLRIHKKRAFNGVLENPVETWPGPSNRIYQVEGACFNVLADRRIITRSFQNMTVGAIATAIVNDDLGADNVTPGTIDDGPLVTEAIFAYIPASRAFDKLSEMANFHWHISGLKVFDMGAPTTFPAPFDLDEIEEYATKAKRSDSNRDYRNRQFIRGGKAETEPRTESWLGNGEQKTFVTGFPIARDPSIEVNGVPQTIAVKGIGDPGAEWFWARGSTEVTQNQVSTPLGSGDTLEIVYNGLFDLVVVSTDVGEVNRRQAVEGFGTGMVDAVETDPTLTNADSAFESAAGKLSRFGVKGRTLNWDTDKEGLEPNQTILVNLPTRGFDGDQLLIAEVSINDVASRLVHSVRAIEGPDTGDWAAWFKTITDFPDPVSFRENIGEEEILAILASFPEVWGWIEDVTPILFVCVLADGSSIIPTSTETYNDATITYGDPGTSYYGDGAALFAEVC